MVLSDDLAKSDTMAENVATKLAESLRSLLNNDVEQWKSNLTVADSESPSRHVQLEPSLKTSRLISCRNCRCLHQGLSVELDEVQDRQNVEGALRHHFPGGRQH